MLTPKCTNSSELWIVVFLSFWRKELDEDAEYFLRLVNIEEHESKSNSLDEYDKLVVVKKVLFVSAIWDSKK